jgi:hypothetical protein
MEKLSAYLPAQSLIYLLICCAGVIVFIIMIILPARKATAELDTEITNLEARIEEQRILNPVFKSLFKRAKAKNESGLPARSKAKLSRDDISDLTTRMQQMVRDHNLQIKELAPDVNSLADNSGFLSVTLSATGQFMDFRSLLVDLGTIPSFEMIESVDISAEEGYRQINLQVWLARE